MAFYWGENEPEWHKREVEEEIRGHADQRYLQYGDPGYVSCKYSGICPLHLCTTCTPSEMYGLEKEYQSIRNGR